ncbi:hypothetical protein ACHAWC_010024 [Mediolabrus comicus]
MVGIRRQRRSTLPTTTSLQHQQVTGGHTTTTTTTRRASLQEEEVNIAKHNWGKPSNNNNNKREWTTATHNTHHHHHYHRSSSSSSAANNAVQHLQWYNFLEEYIPVTPYTFDDSTSSCCALDEYLQCKNKAQKRLHKQQQQQQQQLKREREQEREGGNSSNNSVEQIIMNCSDSELNIYLDSNNEENTSTLLFEEQGGERGMAFDQQQQQQSIPPLLTPPPKAIPTVLASYAEFLPDEPPSSSIRRISFTSPFAENKSNNPNTTTATATNLSPCHPPTVRRQSNNLSMSPSTATKEEHQHAFDTLMSLAKQQQQHQKQQQQQQQNSSSSIARTNNDHHVRFQLSSDDLNQDQIDDTKEEDDVVEEVEGTMATTLMSAGEPSSEGGGDTLDGSGRSGTTSTSRSSTGDSSNSSSGQFSSDVSSGSRFEQPSTTSSSSASYMDKIDEEGVVPASPSSYKELMKMPYVRRNSNPVESDEDFSKYEEKEEEEGDGGGELGVDYSEEKENIVELSSSSPRARDDDVVDSTVTFVTSSSSSTSPLLATTTTTTTEKSQNSSWSVADESSSTSTGDGNKIAVRNCRNDHEFNKAIRGKDEQSSVVLVRQNRTQLEEHIEKGVRGGSTKTSSVDGDATTVVASPRKNNAKGNNNASNKKSAKQRGGDNSKVDAIFPRAYSRNSGSKGIRFRERFVYNWDDGLYENLTIEEKSPIPPLEGSADVAAGTVRSTLLDATVDTRAEGIDTERVEDAKEDVPVTNEEGDDNIPPLPHPDVFERNDTYGSLKTTATVTTADSTIFSRMSSTFSHGQDKEPNVYTFSSMKSFLSQSQIRHLEDAPPELIDILNEQLRILKSRRKDILERATLRDRTQADFSVDDTIQIENSIQFSLFVMKDKVEQLQNILGPLNIDVSDPMMKSVFSDSSGDESSGACSAVTESSEEGRSSQSSFAQIRVESVNVN